MIPPAWDLRRIPGLSVAEFHARRAISTEVTGFADTARGWRVEPRTLFQAGSISKPVAAVAALRLVERGRLDLDADVNSYLRGWRVAENRFTRKRPVTLRRLLTHSAGLTVPGFPGYLPGRARPTLLQILRGAPPANTPAIVVDAVPGVAYRYSGGGFVVLQRILMSVSGLSFSSLLRRYVLRPADMNDSHFAQPLPRRLWRRAATGYGPHRRPIPGRWAVLPELAAAGLWTTPTDLAKFAIALGRAASGDERGLLTRAMARQMLAPDEHGVGLGLPVQARGRTTGFWHLGRNRGFSAVVVANTAGSGLAAMANADEAEPLMARLLFEAQRQAS